jgi:uncharacterized lipoprotein YajG
MKKTLVILALMLAVLTLTGCRKFDNTAIEKETRTFPKETEVTGIYSLVTVDGSKVPATVFHGKTKIKVHSGTFTINADRTCSSKIIFGSPSGEKITRQVNATYSQEGSTLNMQWIGAGRTRGVIKEDIFTMNNEGMIFSYKKQPAHAI